MSEMVDMKSAMRSFRAALSIGEIELEPGRVDPAAFTLVDEADGHLRFTNARLLP